MIRTGIRLFPVLLAAAMLQACATDGEPKAALASAALTPTEQFPIEVRQNPDEVHLAIHDRGLSDGQVAALAALVDRWRDTGGGEVTVQAPRAPDGGRASAYADGATRALVSLGVPLQKVRLVGYDAPAGKPPVLVVGFASYQAVGPTCGHWDDITKTGSNRPYANFGCAMSANMAVQIANPRDLMAPQDIGPADATRRTVILGKYRTGDVTTATKDEQATATTKPPSGGGG